MIPRATYRLQFHAGFTFADAEAIVPYLDALGISHIYASPITTAREGSTHGYDVVDPTRINPELGGEDAFRRLVAALRAHGMGVVIDIVPNHMGVACGGNVWWNDVLAKGEASDHARFFDVDWREKLVLPILAEPLANTLEDGAFRIERLDGRYMLVAHGEHHLPIRDEDQPTAASSDIAALIDRQHYRLTHWRAANDELNWRRFFAINDLAGVRVEDPTVFEETHALYFRLYAEGLIDGVRIDHVDGLTDPARYCLNLRERFDAIPRPDGAPSYIVVEKILAHGEAMPRDWGVNGTSGYDFMEQVSALLHSPKGAKPLADLWADISGRSPDFTLEEFVARRDMLAWQFDRQLRDCVAAFVAVARSTGDCDAITHAMLHRAVERLLWVFPVYRTYGIGSIAPACDAIVRQTVRKRVARFVPPGEDEVVDRILAWLGGEGSGDALLAAEAVRRFQQLSPPIAAKAVEDTGFYRYGRLLSRNDVGFDADMMAMSVADFHAAMIERAAHWPHAMLTTATHDHKRGEDTRARLAVLSEIPERWAEAAVRWLDHAVAIDAEVDAGDAYMLLQSLFGAWPDGFDITDRTALDIFADRIVGWQEKALREAKLRSSWEAPDKAYEERCHALARALLDADTSPAFLTDIAAFAHLTDVPARANAEVQAALRCCLPGVPDLYQGAEFADHSLVDPDNRRPVDFAAREAALYAGPTGKFRVIRDMLALRRDRPALFAQGDYHPIAVIGLRSDNVLAFERCHAGATLRMAVALRCADALASRTVDWWGDTKLATGERLGDILRNQAVWAALV